jgi:hypothetical protein
LTDCKQGCKLHNMLIELIRKQIQTCGKSRYRICQDTGLEQAALCRIMQGKTCTVETADILLKYFGLAIVKKHKPKRKTK